MARFAFRSPLPDAVCGVVFNGSMPAPPLSCSEWLAGRGASTSPLAGGFAPRTRAWGTSRGSPGDRGQQPLLAFVVGAQAAVDVHELATAALPLVLGRGQVVPDACAPEAAHHDCAGALAGVAGELAGRRAGLAAGAQAVAVGAGGPAAAKTG